MNVVNYAKLGDAEIAKLKQTGVKPRLLLHSCCAPCSTHCIEVLADAFELTVFYFNPNIFPKDEYLKRADEERRYLAEAHPEVGCVVADYDHEAFLNAANGLESAPEGGVRCGKCFELRLGAAAEHAKANGFEYFASTLTVSPHKNCALINEIGQKTGEKTGVKWLPYDFKKRDGYADSVRLSARYGLYRQNYCGCEFSLRTPQNGE